jgi:hypothetical protein
VCLDLEIRSTKKREIQTKDRGDQDTQPQNFRLEERPSNGRPVALGVLESARVGGLTDLQRRLAIFLTPITPLIIVGLQCSMVR